jgi:DNA-binding MarR family transcriptional regulator
MDTLASDLETLENAMREFFQTMKRPHNWDQIKQRSGVAIDRPSAVILKLLVSAKGPCRVQDLADHLGIEAPFVTRKTQSLESAGYIKRVTDEHDRRAVDLHLTARGKAVTAKLGRAQREVISQALEQWKPRERHNFVTLFKRFSKDLSAVSHPANHTKERVTSA